MSCRVKAPRFSADDGDAYGYRIPLGGVIVGLLFVSGFRVKTLVRFFGLGNDDVTRRYPSGGVVVELRGFVCCSFNSWREASVAPAWDDLAGLLSLTRDLVVTVLGPRCLLAGSALHGPEREGRRPSPAMAWCDQCNSVRWFSQEARSRTCLVV